MNLSPLSRAGLRAGTCALALTLSLPLAAKETIRLSDCLDYPYSLPTAPFGVRHLMDMAAQKSSYRLEPVIESDSFEFLRNHAVAENIITFQIPIGLSDHTMTGEMITRPLDKRDVPAGVRVTL